ncbi:hypothetical protein JCM19302_3927 [Jejuia pallidilutea]|uniref:Uncharacterized protein n=1 Tax=Jejuia pallidilutea TaxID=504487 RepID=A0A090W0I7_9FLAO|nr:hypothetical protein JCM19302_3927 [Jejuia pallidilutea]GAL87830.1 hypothetical protein JCM19538_2192 [Jejuia pallidilutea]
MWCNNDTQKNLYFNGKHSKPLKLSNTTTNKNFCGVTQNTQIHLVINKIKHSF